MFSDEVTPAVDFTDDAVVQCEFDVPVVKYTSRDVVEILMIANKFWCECVTLFLELILYIV